MKKRSSRRVTLSISFLSVLLFAFGAEAKTKIVTTTPDFAAVAREIGGDRVEVSSLAKGIQDPHFIDAKPSFIRLLNQADLLIDGGADLEVGWLPPLLENSRNGKIQTGAPGRIVAATGVNLLQIPTRPVERSQGDVHPLGNPHYMLDPENGKVVGEQVAATLCRLDSRSCDQYRKNQTAFNQHLDQKMTKWMEKLAPYRGTKIITYHDSWPYFAERFGLIVVGHVEPKPGIPPSPGHLEALVDLITREKPKVILMEPYFSEQAPRFLAQKTGIPVLVLPPSVAPEAGINSYFDLFDQDIDRLADTLMKAEKKP
ncbi:MAG: zinc ABC transporter substrate-binding protein [Nitrospirae bacterium]|nr:zinc ABC transporter substrate-binding protein [Candidatus Manganitrophaceae bacterium]